MVEIVLVSKRAVGIMLTTRLDCKTTVEISHELWQVGIACLPSGDTAQTQFFGQAVLQSLVDPLDTPLGLWCMGTDDLDVKLLHGTSKLRQGVCCAAGRLD